VNLRKLSLPLATKSAGSLTRTASFLAGQHFLEHLQHAARGCDKSGHVANDVALSFAFEFAAIRLSTVQSRERLTKSDFS
jgi:hypothetical protein